jgi:hypothetical protein
MWEEAGKEIKGERKENREARRRAEGKRTSRRGDNKEREKRTER